MYYLRRLFEEQFTYCTGRTHIGDTCTFYSHNIEDEDVKLSL